METLIQLIRSIHPVSALFEESLHRMLTREVFLRHSHIIEPGQVSAKMYFVESGIVRGYCINEGKDITTGFMRRGDFVISPVSFFLRQPTEEYLGVMTDTVLWAITYSHLQGLYARFLEFNVVGRVLTEQYYVRSELRAHHLRMLSIEERYAAFCLLYPDLLTTVPLKHIASLLGSTPETISRIRVKKV